MGYDLLTSNTGKCDHIGNQEYFDNVYCFGIKSNFSIIEKCSKESKNTYFTWEALRRPSRGKSHEAIDIFRTGGRGATVDKYVEIGKSSSTTI